VKAARLRAVDAKRVPMPGADPGLPDLVAWLREHPATYEQLVQTAQVAGEWASICGNWFRANARSGFAARAFQRTDGLWTATVLGIDLDDVSATLEEARDAADAELCGLGWTLVVTP
jgi:hypothetical protein